MVQKFGKFGVRSGNSLKGSNSKYFRRYRRDALVYRESINCVNVQTSPETIIGQTDVTSDEVPYSLNKKGRWSLPDDLKRAILTGELRQEEFGVQLVELHKINKAANCVAVYATRGPLGKLAIQKRKRTRHRKGTGYMQAKSIVNAKSPSISKRKRRDLQRRGLYNENENVDAEEEPSQIRYEVVYPSPVTSSVTHNPKYIGHDTAKPHTRIGHKKRRRKHHSDFISDELFDMDQQFDESEDEDCYHDNEHSYRRMKPERILIGDIVKHTEQAKQRYQMGQTKKHQKDSTTGKEEHAKQSKLIYTYVREEESPEENTEVKSSNPVPEKQIKPLSEPVYVYLKVDDINPISLQGTYGEAYIEAECFPRKFIVDISEMASQTKLIKNYWKHCPDRINANVVFVFDVDNEVNTLQEHVYKIYLNTPLQDDASPMRIETMFDYMETTVHECLSRSVFFMDIIADQLYISATNTVYAKTGPSTTEALANWKTSSYIPNNNFVYKTFLTASRSCGNVQRQRSMPSMDSYSMDENSDISSQTDRLCSICYETLGPRLSGTALIACGHWFCEICWKEYLESQVKNGATSFVCPEFDCDTAVDPGTAMSFLYMKDIIMYAKRCHDTKVEQQVVTKWCPNEKCGRVIQVNSDQVEIANCACGRNVCFKCNANNHWPAPCETSKWYNKKLRDEGLDGSDHIDEPSELVVHGRTCPHCKQFVEKNGGCPYMYCVCRHSFCWGCGKDWFLNEESHANCYRKGSNDVHSGTFKRRVKPVLKSVNDKTAVDEAQRLFDTAVQHRGEQHRERVKQMKLPAKDLCKKLQLFVVRATAKGEKISLDINLSPEKDNHTSDNVRAFLNQMISLHSEINHIAEHTAVLLLGAAMADVNPDKFLKYVLIRFQSFSTMIHECIVRGHEWRPRDVINALSDVKFHSEKAIKALIKQSKTTTQN